MTLMKGPWWSWVPWPWRYVFTSPMVSQLSFVLPPWRQEAVSKLLSLKLHTNLIQNYWNRNSRTENDPDGLIKGTRLKRKEITKWHGATDKGQFQSACFRDKVVSFLPLNCAFLNNMRSIVLAWWKKWYKNWFKLIKYFLPLTGVRR